MLRTKFAEGALAIFHYNFLGREALQAEEAAPWGTASSSIALVKAGFKPTELPHYSLPTEDADVD
jgi:hypothetical protein